PHHRDRPTPTGCHPGRRAAASRDPTRRTRRPLGGNRQQALRHVPAAALMVSLSNHGGVAPCCGIGAPGPVVRQAHHEAYEGNGAWLTEARGTPHTPLQNLIPVPSTRGIIIPSPHRSEIMTSGWCGETGVPRESSRGGTGRTGGELRATIRNFALPAPTRRTGEAEPQLFADYPLRGESLAGAASSWGKRQERLEKSGRRSAAPEVSARQPRGWAAR